MSTTVINPPLSNLQVEKLKLFATDIHEENLKEVKSLVAHYLLEKARDKADEVWQAKGFTEESFERQITLSASFDQDDNKFVDCDFVANANFLVTDDKHYKILESVSFPTINILSLTEFSTLLETKNS